MKERLDNSVLETAINVCKSVIKAGEEEDTDYDATFDKIKLKLLEELKQYRELEEQKLLIKLPCNVGSTVYSIHHLPLSKKSIISEVANVDIFFLLLAVAENKFGETVFLTQAEAEEKLRELRRKSC